MEDQSGASSSSGSSLLPVPDGTMEIYLSMIDYVFRNDNYMLYTSNQYWVPFYTKYQENLHIKCVQLSHLRQIFYEKVLKRISSFELTAEQKIFFSRIPYSPSILQSMQNNDNDTKDCKLVLRPRVPVDVSNTKKRLSVSLQRGTEPTDVMVLTDALEALTLNDVPDQHSDTETNFEESSFLQMANYLGLQFKKRKYDQENVPPY